MTLKGMHPSRLLLPVGSSPSCFSPKNNVLASRRIFPTKSFDQHPTYFRAGLVGWGIGIVSPYLPKIFACLDEAECARLAHTIADVRLEPGEWLFREGAPAAFHVLFEGRLRMALDVHGKLTEFPEYELKQGEFLGEVPLMLGTPFFGSVRALSSCRIARLDRQQFSQLSLSGQCTHPAVTWCRLAYFGDGPISGTGLFRGRAYFGGTGLFRGRTG
jgi:hypothetical protein